MQIKFNNWGKYQPRKDYKRPWWLALANDFPIDHKFTDFSNEEKLIFIFLLCETSKQRKGGKCDIYPDNLSRMWNVRKQSILQTIEKLIEKGICTESVQNPNATEHYITLHNRTEQNTLARNDEKSSSSQKYPEELDQLKQTWQSRGVAVKAVEAMLLAFPDPPWLAGEVRKAEAWEAANPKRRKKNFGRFLMNWLARAWDSRQHKALHNDGIKITPLDELELEP